MANHSELCPVCRGSGVFIVPVDPHNHGSSGEAQRINCHGCGGYGWVIVTDDPVVAVVSVGDKDCFNCDVVAHRKMNGTFGKEVCPNGYPLPNMGCWKPTRGENNA